MTSQYPPQSSRAFELRKSEDISISTGLLGQDHSYEDDMNHSVGQRRFALWVTSGRVIMYATLFFSMIVGFSFYTRTQINQRPSCSCGGTLEEARALDCKYDSLAAAWLPPACRDDENTSEFETTGPGPNGSWIYYSDWDRTSILTIEEIANLPNTGGHFFTTHDWHVQHCLYIWRKIWRAPMTGVTIEGNIDTDGHLKHCGEMFRKRNALNEVVTGSGVTLNADHIEEHKHH